VQLVTNLRLTFLHSTSKILVFVEIPNMQTFCICRQFEQHNAPFSSFGSLVENLLTAQATNRLTSPSGFETQHRADAQSASEAACSPRSSSQYASVKQELEHLQKMSLCKNCFQAKAAVVLLPCGHLALCSDCSRESSTCPLCKAVIRETIHSYIV